MEFKPDNNPITSEQVQSIWDELTTLKTNINKRIDKTNEKINFSRVDIGEAIEALNKWWEKNKDKKNLNVEDVQPLLNDILKDIINYNVNQTILKKLKEINK